MAIPKKEYRPLPDFLESMKINALSSRFLLSKTASQLIWMIWNLGSLYGAPGHQVIKLLVLLFSLGEGEMPKASTKVAQLQIVRKAFVKALAKLFDNPPGFPDTLPEYCTFEMAGRIVMSHTGKYHDAFPFEELDYGEELKAMDEAGDNVLDALEIDALKHVFGLEQQDKEMALACVAERFPHRNWATWNSLAAMSEEIARQRFKSVSPTLSNYDIETYVNHFKKRFPSSYKLRRIYTPVHDQVLAAAYKARHYCRFKDGEVAKTMHERFPHRSEMHWQQLMNLASDTWLQLCDFSKFYDDRVWRSFYMRAKDTNRQVYLANKVVIVPRKRKRERRIQAELARKKKYSR